MLIRSERQKNINIKKEEPPINLALKRGNLTLKTTQPQT